MRKMSDIGEKSFLAEILPKLDKHSYFLNGFGHDSSVIDLGLEQNLAFKIDRAATPVSISKGWSDHKVWGRLAVVANVSDLLATGATPKAIMLSVTVPRDYDVQNVIDIIEGCQETCKDLGIAFVGGDTKEGATPQVVGSAIGVTEKNKHLGRSSAKAGDHLVLAGKLGACIASISLLERKEYSSINEADLLRVIEKPEAKTKEAHYVISSGLAVAGCDLSDGLNEALEIFCKDGAGITIHESKLPLHQYAHKAASIMNTVSHKFAFSVGDWAIAYVIKKDSLNCFMSNIPDNLDIYHLGTFDSTGVIQLQLNTELFIKPPSLVNEHFRQRLEDNTSYVATLLE